MEKTNVMRILDQKKINYKEYTYENAISGIEVANILNQNPNQVFKTLVTKDNQNKLHVYVIPVNKELDLKKCAKVSNVKSIEMLKSKDLLPNTGYIHGGCSPIGMKKFYPTIFDISANNFNTIIFSGGKIGYQVELSLEDLKKVINYRLEDITKED